MWLSKGGTPVPTTDRENGELGNDDGSADSSSDFLGGLDSETNMSLTVTDNNDSLEPGTLTGTSLLLDRFNLFPPKPNSLVPNLANRIYTTILMNVTFITSSFNLGKKKSTI